MEPHPDIHDTSPAERAKGETSTGVRIFIGALIAIVVVVIVLHLTGVVGPLAD
jgi:hypothetical protein